MSGLEILAAPAAGFAVNKLGNAIFSQDPEQTGGAVLPPPQNQGAGHPALGQLIAQQQQQAQQQTQQNDPQILLQQLFAQLAPFFQQRGP